MVNHVPSLDETFAALADPTRRAILHRLAHGQLSTTVLAEPFAMSLPAVLKHLRVLETAGLVMGEKQGRVHRYRLRPVPLADASVWLDQYRVFWEARLDALEQHLKEGQIDDR